MKKIFTLLIGSAMVTVSASQFFLKESPHHSTDKSNMFNAIYTFPDQINQGITIGKKIPMIQSKHEIRNIVFAGMGGSAISGDIAIALCRDTATIPMVTNRNYTLPRWVNKHTLVVLLVILEIPKKLFRACTKPLKKMLP